jgi:hypothetical protein
MGIQPYLSKGLEDFVTGFQGVTRRVTDELVRQVGFPSRQDVFEYGRDLALESQGGEFGVPIQRLIQRFTGQPRELAPHIDPTDCPSCQRGDLESLANLRAQEGQLRDELQIESQQQRAQQQRAQQRQLQQFRDLERQPPEQRDIPRELQQKQQLLQQIQQEIQDIQRGQPTLQLPNPQDSGQGTPPSGVPHIDSPGEHGHLVFEPNQTGEGPPLMHQRTPPDEMPVPDANTVMFCVSCTSQNEALKFLNGEPAQCSVMPQ